jgi:mono/diheme cytochrome c family protein
MSKKEFRLIAALALMVLVLAACGGTAGTGDTSTQAVPQTGATLAAGAGVTCAGVDTQQLMATGATVYSQECASCHGAQGEGVGDFPPLAMSADMTANDVVAIVQSYFSVEAHPRTLPVDELAGALTFARGSFGNMAGAICPEQITVPVP